MTIRGYIVRLLDLASFANMYYIDKIVGFLLNHILYIGLISRYYIFVF